MADDESGPDRVLAAHNVQVCAADRRERDADDGFARARARALDLLHAGCVLPVKNIRPHLRHFTSLLARHGRVDSIYGGGPSAFPNACDALDADAEDDGRGRSRVPREKGFDRGELWEERKQAAHRAFALRRAGNLTVSAIGQHALPSEMVLDLVNLQTDARVGAHRLDFATGQRVNEEGLSVENV